MALSTPQRALLDIQQLDVDIAKIQNAMAEHESRRKIAALRERAGEIDAIVTQLDEQVHQLDLRYGDSQYEVQALRDKIESDRVALNAAGHREAILINRDIEVQERKVDSMEFMELKMLEDRDALTAKLALAHTKRDEVAAAIEDISDRFRVLSTHAMARVAELNKRRTTLAASVDAELFGRYEQLALSHGGVGAGPLADDRCGACNMRLATGQLAAIRSGGEFATCPQCKRILVVATPEVSAPGEPGEEA